MAKNFGGKYIYILDKKMEIYSDEEIGNIGDTVYVECEINEIKKAGRMEEILKVNPTLNIIMITSLGAIFLIVSFINIFLVIRKKKSIEKESSQPYQIAKLYEDIEDDDEETFLYKFLKTKDNTPVSSIDQMRNTGKTGQRNIDYSSSLAFSQPDAGFFPNNPYSQPSINDQQFSKPQPTIENSSGRFETSSFKSHTVNKMVELSKTQKRPEDITKQEEIHKRTTRQIIRAPILKPQIVQVQSRFGNIKQKPVLSPVLAKPAYVTQPTITKPTVKTQPTEAGQAIRAKPVTMAKPVIKVQPPKAQQPIAMAQPSIKKNALAGTTNIESTTERLKHSADRLKFLTEKMQVPIAQPTANPPLASPNKTEPAKIMKVKIPTAKSVQPSPYNVPQVKKPILAKPVANHEINSSTRILDLYKGIESEDDEITLYKSLHSIKETKE